MMTATQNDEARTALAASGMDAPSVISILDWITGLGLSWDKAWSIVQAFIACFSGGVTFAKVVTLVQTVISIIGTMPPSPPPPVVM
jgi:uncharacterized protein (DUF697 family)